MKKLIVTLGAALACVAAFGQGKVSFQTDSLHLVYYDTSVPNYGGHSIIAASAPVPLMADLYIGTSSNSLTLATSTTFSASPGKWGTVGYTDPTAPGGTVVFIITQIRDATTTPHPTLTPQDAGSPLPRAYGAWWGTSQEFQFTLGTSAITYPVMWGANGNWPVGQFPLGGIDGNPAGAQGAINVFLVPEPTSFALAGLGAAALLIFRRRK